MKKFTIFLTILIFLIGGLIGGYFIGQNAETIKSWFEKESTPEYPSERLYKLSKRGVVAW